MLNILKIKGVIFSVVITLFTVSLNGQSLNTNPCAEPAASEWTVGGGCIATSTAGFTNLFDPASCNSGVFDDGWAWYIGTGAGNTITYTPDPGFDAVIHLFEVSDPAVCSVLELGCSDDGGAGVSESIVGGGILGTLYYIRIQLIGSNTTMTGCLDVVANPATCDDGIQNGTETGIDCGGSCPYTCPPPTTSSTSSPCSTTINTPVDVIDCSLIGTPGFNSTTGVVNYGASAKLAAPTPAPSCGGTGGGGVYGTWVALDPLTGVTAATIDVPGAVTGTDDIFFSLYQGADCSALTEVGCEMLLNKSTGTFSLEAVNFSGIDDTQPLWAYVYSPKAFSFEASFLGLAGLPSNDECATAEPATGPGCNLGATPSSFIPPSNYSAAICAGGTWYSNENTIYYSFTPTTTAATLEIDGIACNDGSGGGISQFGVWETCAAVNLAPTGANGFLGCVVGTSPLSLTGLTVGQTYYIVVDGNAGSLCSWDFAATGGIVLPIDLLDFTAELIENKRVNLDWVTTTEINNDFFTIERSADGIVYEVVGIVSGSGNSNMIKSYDLVDETPYKGLSYYRLKQTDFDGKYTYSQVVDVNVKDAFENVIVFPNPVKGPSNLSFEAIQDGLINLSVYDVSGREVMNMNHSVKQGNNTIELETSLLRSGMYFLKFENSNGKVNVKFIKD
jgi:hypothetical protein